MGSEKEIKQALVKFSYDLATELIKNIPYEFHYEAQVLSVEDNTCAVYIIKTNTTKEFVRYMSHLQIKEGDLVMVRETNGVPDSLVIDEVVRD